MRLLRRVTKRAFDLVGAGVAVLATGPLLAAAAAAARAEVGAPALTRYLRAGRGGEPFAMWQLRTHDASELGAWLRATGVDQLPALWNVVRGEMSLVGPRPLHPQYVAMARERFAVKPGLVGWAQLHRGRSATWDDEQALDRWYVEHGSLTVDALIVVRAVLDRLRGQPRGAAAAPEPNPAGRAVDADAVLN